MVFSISRNSFHISRVRYAFSAPAGDVRLNHSGHIEEQKSCSWRILDERASFDERAVACPPSAATAVQELHFTRFPHRMNLFKQPP